MTIQPLLDQWTPRLMSVLRIAAGLLFFEHGTSKLLGFPNLPMPDGFHLFPLMGLSGILEFLGGGLLALGLFTRPAAFVISGEMAFAYFMVHAPRGFFPILNQGELAVLYCFLFLFFAAAGAGPWSIDELIRKRKAG